MSDIDEPRRRFLQSAASLAIGGAVLAHTRRAGGQPMIDGGSDTMPTRSTVVRPMRGGAEPPLPEGAPPEGSPRREVGSDEEGPDEKGPDEGSDEEGPHGRRQDGDQEGCAGTSTTSHGR